MPGSTKRGGVVAACLGLAMLGGASANAAASESATSVIDEACDAGSRARDTAPLLLSPLVLPEVGERGAWLAVPAAPERAIGGASDDADASNTAVQVHPRRGSVRLVDASFASPSGDWFIDAEYCYRKDGSLARLVGRLGTFYVEDEGAKPLHRTRTMHFDASGGLIAEAIRVDGEMPGEPPRTYIDEQEPVWLRLSRAPFRQARHRGLRGSDTDPCRDRAAPAIPPRNSPQR